MSKIISHYLDLLDRQCEAAFSALDGLTDEQIRQRPAPKEWNLGKITDHNYLPIASSYPLVKLAWRMHRDLAHQHLSRPVALRGCAEIGKTFNQTMNDKP